ncbi:hypothetical protein [Streptomyces spectabilis]|nr:hypothetical protein [Streptomyces spectabilis]
MGNYYEIWQKDRENGKPLSRTTSCVSYTAPPGKFNLQDSTWD